jgi:hypothetical protein
VPTSTAAPRRATPALCVACTQTIASIAASCITCQVSSKHVDVATHGHHAVLVSRARRGPRNPCRIELLPLSLRRQEPKDHTRASHNLAIIGSSLLVPAPIFLNLGHAILANHVEVVAHGHHALLVLCYRRGARDPCRIELLPLLLRRREPKEVIAVTCTVQDEHTTVSLKSQDDTILCRAPGAPSESRCVYDHRRPRCDSRCQKRGDVLPAPWVHTHRLACYAALALGDGHNDYAPCPAVYPPNTCVCVYIYIAQGTRGATGGGAAFSSKHVEVAAHCHHSVFRSPARRGAPCLIELRPLPFSRREPKELIQKRSFRRTCTVQHAHTPVSLKSHDDTILCRDPGAPSDSCKSSASAPRL